MGDLVLLSVTRVKHNFPVTSPDLLNPSEQRMILLPALFNQRDSFLRVGFQADTGYPFSQARVKPLVILQSSDKRLSMAPRSMVKPVLHLPVESQITPPQSADAPYSQLAHSTLHFNQFSTGAFQPIWSSRQTRSE